MINSITKPAKTYKEQIHLLKEKGIIIKDELKAELFLSRINYYKLSGYYLPYIDKSTEKITTKITLNRIETIYKFDRELTGLILKVVGEIEIYLRSSIAYYHGRKYGGEGYELSVNFNKFYDHNRLLEDIHKYAERNKLNPVIMHHNERYHGHYPIWVIIEFFELGSLSAFYKGMINHDKADLAKSLYGVNNQILESWLGCLCQMRNKCCHFNRLYYSIFSFIPKSNTFDDFTPDRQLFTQLMVLKRLYPDKDKWKQTFVRPLLMMILKYNMFSELKNIGFPKNWYYLIK